MGDNPTDENYVTYLLPDDEVEHSACFGRGIVIEADTQMRGYYLVDFGRRHGKWTCDRYSLTFLSSSLMRHIESKKKA